MLPKVARIDATAVLQNIFLSSPKVTSIFGYFWKQIFCQELSKSPNEVTLSVNTFGLFSRYINHPITPSRSNSLEKQNTFFTLAIFFVHFRLFKQTLGTIPATNKC